MKKNLIYLTGFMGCGKSTIGPILANTLGWGFYDLDRVIEGRQKRRITEIFEAEGEAFFRKLETDVLTELSKLDRFVISLGGGTIISDINLGVLKKSGKIVYLYTSPELIYDRLKHKRDRPIFKKENSGEVTKEEFLEKINLLMEQRAYYYEQADIKFTTDEKSVGKSVDEIAKYFKREM
jgi:shikimate kinase